MEELLDLKKLQERLLRYLELNGCKHSWRKQTLKCEMPEGGKVSVFASPKLVYNGAGRLVSLICGIIILPWRRYGRVRYLDEKGAAHLYRRLGEHINLLEEGLNNKEEKYDRQREIR